MRPFYEIILKPLVTEKSMLGRARGVYAFQVAGNADKREIRQAVEGFFKVEVDRVRTIRILGKRRRFGRHVGKSSPWKKAVVTLKEGQKIELLEVE